MSTETDTSIAIVVPGGDDLPPSLLSNIHDGFKEAYEQAEKWRKQALAIKVTSLDQKAEMKMARTIRLELKAIRVQAEKNRKMLKEDSLRMGRAIDGVNNVLLLAIEPLEKYLQEQEDFGERLAEAERQRLKAEREAILAPFLGEGQPIALLEAMSGEQWDRYLADAKLLHQAKIDAAKKAEEDRIAREKAEAEERERIRLENEQLRREAAEREAQAKAEREKMEAERAASEAKLKAEQEKAAAELAEQQRLAAKAAQDAEAKALAERKAVEAKARAEREAADKVLAAERAERERLEKIEADRQAAELAAAQAEAARKAAAEAAPDKDRLTKLASDIRALHVPMFQTKRAASMVDAIAEAIEALAVRVENAAKKL